jgi:hypothetical protein
MTREEDHSIFLIYKHADKEVKSNEHSRSKGERVEGLEPTMIGVTALLARTEGNLGRHKGFRYLFEA